MTPDLKPLLRRCLSEIEWLQTTNSRSNGVARIGLLKDEIRAALSAPANDEEDCGKPCDPKLGNACCEDYWARMKREGFWDGGKWTDKGWKEITK